MSLVCWLPLNGDLTQQGTSNISMINSNATVNTNGKIGSCYYFNASSYLYENTYDWTNFNTSQFSLCCWYKQPSPVASGNSQIICIGTSSGWNNIRIGLLRRTSSGYPMFSVSNGSSAVQYNCTATTFSLDTWNHIACTYDNGTIKIYLNGILDRTYTTTIAPVLNSSQHLGVGAASNGAEKLTGYLNDVRIYDHCLSAAEVREISQGLVLHYRLDRKNLRPIGTNLVTGVTKGGQTSLLTDGRIGVITSGTNADTYFTVNLSETITNGTTYYLSCDVSGVSSGQYWGFPLGSQSNTSMPSKFYNGHNEYVFTANDINWGTNRLFLDDNYRNDYAHPASFYNFVLIKNPTFEAIDESGYGYNSISNAPITSSTDTPRYNEASYFGAYNTPNLILTNPTTLLPTLSNCTITWWGKYDTVKTLLLTGHTTVYYLAASNDNIYYHGNAGTITFYKDGVAGNYKCAADGWHFFAMTGVNISSWTALKLNGYGSGWPLNGYISDLRIYSTILDDDAIRQLYEVGAKVDNKQNLHAFELVENNSKIQITKRGQVKCNELEEDENTKFYQADQIIETNEIIEL